MRYWWANQNQTYRHEIVGGYLWSPKRNKNHRRNPFYEYMREVSPEDLILSYYETRIAALGIARSYCYESPKPLEFGATGSVWGDIGWKIEVSFRELTNRVRPKDHIEKIRSLLPRKYYPLTQKGNGLQSIYLTEISLALFTAIAGLIGYEANQVAQASDTIAKGERGTPAVEPALEEWEHRLEVTIENDRSLVETERLSLIQARRGQGAFRTNVQKIERGCRVTKVERREHLIASHVKPWRDSSNSERLDGENGLLLTPTIDHLFDKGFISFEDRGGLIVSPVADVQSLRRMGISVDTPLNVGVFSQSQRRFLDYHRDNVLRRADIRRK